MTLEYKTQPIIPDVIYWMDTQQMYAEKGNELLFDIECYSNFFLIGFKSYVTGRVKFFEQSHQEDIVEDELRWLVQNCTLVGFNITGYDLPMLWACLAGLNCGQLKSLSDDIITNKRPQMWRLEKKHGFKRQHCDSIDLQTVAPALAQHVSLKHYGARMHLKKLQELPVDPQDDLSYEDGRVMRLYNINDLDVTGWLRHSLDADLELRRSLRLTYGMDLRSRSDAQIAEKVIAAEIQSQTGVEAFVPSVPAGTKFKFKNPDYIKFYTPKLRELHTTILNQVFEVNDKGNVDASTIKMWKTLIGKTKYKLGIGGLHSQEKQQTYFSDTEHRLIDRDVASYYPAIIINQSLFPEHIGPAFLQTYKELYHRRLKAKETKDKVTADALKISLNGSFGKLGSRYSIFYSPELLIQVTITGQLSLLMLIEMLEWRGIPVVSANTDGVVIRCPQVKKADYLQTVQEWEQITNFTTEETRYKSIHSRDVNNYIAITNDGEIKAKGSYTNKLSFKNKNRETLMSNPNAEIVSEAVMLFLKDGTTVDKTITKCRDITKFLFVKRVNGGAVKDGVHLGKVVRWYYRKGDQSCIRNFKPNKAGIRSMVGDSQGGNPLMELPKVFPIDVDYSRYISRAKKMLIDLGYYSINSTQLELF